MEISGPFGKAIATVLRIWTMPIFRFGVRNDRVIVDIFPATGEATSIDDRLAQLDVARKNVEGALTAIDEMKAVAERNRAELHEALAQIDEIRADRNAAESELHVVRQIAQADIGVFRKLAGLPTRVQIARERFLGFVLGVISSLVAAAIMQALARYLSTRAAGR